MKRKGFTLIELLAVIAILSILVILAVPKVLQLFSDARKNAFETEARNIVKAAERGYASKLFKGNVSETTITYIDGVELKTGNISLNISGKKIQDGQITITTAGEVSIAIHNGEYCATKSIDSDGITVEESSLEECILIESTPEECFVTDLSLAPVFIQDFYVDIETFFTPEELILVGVMLPSEIEENETVIYYYNYENPTCTSNVMIPNTINGKNVVGIGLMSFMLIDAEGFPSDGMGITSVSFPSTLEMIAMHAFPLNQISNLVIPENVISLGMETFVFNQISDLTILNGLTDIGVSVFRENQLTTVTIPNSVTSIGNYAFAENEISQINFGTGLATISERAFANNRLTDLTIPNSVTTIGTYAFADNIIDSLSIASSVTSIEAAAFNNNQLSDLNAFVYARNPDGTENNSILVSYGGSRRTNIIVPGGIINIGQDAFRQCQINSVAIPNSVTYIGELAFAENYILQGNATIDNSSSAVVLDLGCFQDNGADGSEEITPVFLR